MATGSEIAAMLHEQVDRDMTFMHICGTHEAAIARTGLRSILPKQLKIVMGPGCPVCITPQGEIDAALDLNGTPAISPIISGRAWVIGTHQLMVDPDDPFQAGYRLSDTWPMDN